MSSEVDRVLDSYPRIFLACHVRHVRDPESQRLLTGNQVEILDQLSATGAIGIKELSRHLGVKPPTMSVAVDRLVRHGYVVRVHSDADRRRIEISLTQRGRRVVEEHSVLEPDRIRAMLDELGDDERREALAGLEKLATAADRLLAKIGSGWSLRDGSEE